MHNSSLCFCSVLLCFTYGFFACFALTTANYNISTDQNALLAFKSHITSDPLQILSTNWSNSAVDVCGWIGVTCSSTHRRVTALKLAYFNLSGTIPPHLGNLSFLLSLNLSSNNFNGELPSDLARLRRLRVIDLSFNRLGPELSPWLGSLQELQILNLRNNSFNGEIPRSIFNATKLERLSIMFNSMEGVIPNEIRNLQNLKFLNLGVNRLSGDIPLEIFNISSIEVVFLSMNSFSGGLPNSMCRKLQQLSWFDARQNALNGPMPSNLSGCSKLRELNLGSNNFTGSLPKDLGIIQILVLERNNLQGVIPKEISNSTILNVLILTQNKFTGEIPREFGTLFNLEMLSLESNDMWGFLPIEIFNLSKIRIFAVGDNHFQGNLPSIIGQGFPNLERLFLSENNFNGPLPNSITNCSQLIRLDIVRNRFSGVIPNSLGNLKLLIFLNLAFNDLTTSQDLSFLTSLANCRNLETLGLGNNPLNGFIPTSIGNLSSSIQQIFLSNSNLIGTIPDEIGNLTNLIRLSLSGNQLTGTISSAIAPLRKLQILNCASNNLSGVMLSSVCGLQSLYELTLMENQISGSIPDCLGNLTSLRTLGLYANKLSSSLPVTFWNLKDLLRLDLSYNSLGGSLPLQFGNLQVALSIELSMNKFSGEIPSTISSLRNLNNISLAYNMFTGSIPASIGQILSLTYLDLSHNNLTGSIPTSLEKIESLGYLNVSYNNLRGEIPTEGPFRNFTRESFMFNEGLCGSSRFNVSACPEVKNPRSKGNVHWSVFLAVGILSVIGVMGLVLVCVKWRKGEKVPNETDTLSLEKYPKYSYFELLQATNKFNEINLLGTGSFGTVYKGEFKDGRILAIKVFNLQMDGGFKSFETECEVLRNLRHRNLTKVISSCSNNVDFGALVLEYMPNGSLDKWLYSHNHFLDILQRLNVMIDVALALEYLHTGDVIPVVHLDLKPGNVLLDANMVAHVSDFGIAKLLGGDCTTEYTKTLATLGYMAPEYGSEGLVSTKCDIYSYGILLMEVFTRMKPCSEMLGDNLSLKDWVENSRSDAFAQVIDSNLLKTGEEYYKEKLKCASSLMEVALNCSRDSPKERSNIQEVLTALNKIRLELLQYCSVA